MNITPPGDVRHLQRHRLGGRKQHRLSGVQRIRQCDPDGGRDAVQSDLPALRRHGQTAERLSRPATATAASPAPDTVEVRIPPGVPTGSRLRVAGKGNAGTIGAPPGDLYITIRVEQHPFFERDGDNIQITRAGDRVRRRRWAPRSKCRPSTGARCSRFRRARRTARSSACAKRASSIAQENTRGDQIVEVVHAGAQGAGRAHARNAPRARRSCNRGPAGRNLDESVAGAWRRAIESRLHDLGGRGAVRRFIPRRCVFMSAKACSGPPAARATRASTPRRISSGWK